MPFLFTLAAVGVVLVLIALGWRRRWDPTPQVLPPVTLASVRSASSSPMKMPRWLFATLFVGPPVLLLSGYLAYRLQAPWLAVAGYIVFGAGWVARQIAMIWMRAETWILRVAAVVRPLTLVAGAWVAVISRSIVSAVVAGVLYVAILPIADVLERRTKRVVDREGALPPPRSG